MTYREATLKLTALGCYELPRHGSGSHRKWCNPATQRISVLPDRGGRDLKIGTVHAVIRQLGIDWHDFENA
ncbi:MAG: type II toxin-antitoxin system HicA family toxin [Patescibacteria group bacterium]